MDSSMDATTRETEAVYAYALLNCLLSVLRTKAEAGHSDIAKYIDQLVPRLLTIFVLAALSPYAESEIAADPRLVIVASRVVEAVVQTLSAECVCLFISSMEGSNRLRDTLLPTGDRPSLRRLSSPRTGRAKLRPSYTSRRVCQRRLDLILSLCVPLRLEIELHC